MLAKTSWTMKPPPAARLDAGHPLAQSLAGCWLLNEAAGRTAHDAAGRHHHGSFSGGPLWSPGRFGPALQFDGNDDWVSMGDCLDLGTDDVSLLAIVKYSAASQPNEWSGLHFGAIAGKGHIDGSSRGYGMSVQTENKILWAVRDQTQNFTITSDNALNDGEYHVAVGVCDRDSATGLRLYIDGARQAATADPTAINGNDLSGTRAFAIGSRQEQSSGIWFWDYVGTVAAVYVWKRVLTEAEIRLLQADPFFLFARRRAAVLSSAAATHIVECGGQATAVTSASGTAQVLPGPAALRAVPPTETPWLREALFNGMTGTAFKLQTVLTCGWFWLRRRGCTAIYRGPSLGQVDFDGILQVTEAGTTEFSLPAHLPHPAGSTYCYLARRFNSRGHQEQTTAAAVMVRIGPDGELAGPAPNAGFGLRAEQVSGPRLRLLWSHCPLDQQAAPEQFNLYWDGGAGQVDLENPIATIPYEGRKLYRYESGVLADGRYTFVVAAQSAEHVESLVSQRLDCQVTSLPPEPAEIIAVETV